MNGRIIDLTRDLSGNLRVTLEVKTDPVTLEELRDKDLTIEMKPYRPKRSRNANAYAWVLIGKIAEKLGISPREVYRQTIQDIGGNYDIICVRTKDVEGIKTSWERIGMGWMAEELDSKIKGCTNLMLWYGSSTYDSRQMSLLIDRIVDEAKELGIETATPEELAILKGEHHDAT